MDEKCPLNQVKPRRHDIKKYKIAGMVVKVACLRCGQENVYPGYIEHTKFIKANLRRLRRRDEFVQVLYQRGVSNAQISRYANLNRIRRRKFQYYFGAS